MAFNYVKLPWPRAMPWPRAESIRSVGRVDVRSDLGLPHCTFLVRRRL